MKLVTVQYKFWCHFNPLLIGLERCFRNWESPLSSYYAALIFFLKAWTRCGHRWEPRHFYWPKLRSYILFKHEYCAENYVNYCIPHKERSLLAQIRFGILPLHIELGRHISSTCVKFVTVMEMNSILYENCSQMFFNSLKEKCAIFNTLTTREKFILLMKK